MTPKSPKCGSCGSTSTGWCLESAQPLKTYRCLDCGKIHTLCGWWTSKKLCDLARSIETFAERLHDLDIGEPYSYDSWDISGEDLEVEGVHYCRGDSDYRFTPAPLEWLALALNGEEWEHLVVERRRERERVRAEQKEQSEKESAAAQEIAERAQLDRLLEKYGKPLGPNEEAGDIWSGSDAS